MPDITLLRAQNERGKEECNGEGQNNRDESKNSLGEEYSPTRGINTRA